MIRHRELVIPWQPREDHAGLRDREWLITNGLGGYASGSLAGIPTRKYHGLFVPNLSAPKGRFIMISRCDEEVLCEGKRVLLGGAEFESGRSVGQAQRYLREFRLDHRIAIWLFDIDGTVIEKSVVLPHNQNTVCVGYRMLSGKTCKLKVRPFMSFRRHDEAPTREPAGPFTFSICRGRHEVRIADSPLVLRMDLRPAPAVFVSEEFDDIDLLYRVEKARGDPHLESAYCPGYFRGYLTPEQPVTFVATTQGWDTLEFDVFATFDAERRRMTQLLARGGPQFEGDDFAEQLAMAADQFVVLPGSRLEERVLAEAEGTELRTVIAGYHWFGDWGRDTMISLEGLTLCTCRHREAKAILRTFSHYVRDGLLPNLFPEGERQALYHTVDATLWYFHAIDRYVTVTGDTSLVVQLYPVLLSIVEHHLRGTHYNIHADPSDGLISAAAEGYQLTWMDAKMGDWVVTPRRGKPVEIQALWYNALRLMGVWTRYLPEAPVQPVNFDEHAECVRAAFNGRYFNEQTRCLYDVIDGPQGDDPSIRPNQVFTMSLRHPVLDRDRWPSVLDIVRTKLVTPYGLRTLSAEHPDYKRNYRGDLPTRDGAYHQGTVWPWLIGHFIDASLKLEPDRVHMRQYLQAFRDHLFVAGVGSISEVFDAEEPFQPGGCVAQAWSVAEVLRAWLATRE